MTRINNKIHGFGFIYLYPTILPLILFPLKCYKVHYCACICRIHQQSHIVDKNVLIYLVHFKLLSFGIHCTKLTLGMTFGDINSFFFLKFFCVLSCVKPDPSKA